jgi:hypothetical protein
VLDGSEMFEMLDSEAVLLGKAIRRNIDALTES